MRATLVAVCLMSTVLLSTFESSDADCCKSVIKCSVGGKTTKRCYDCSEATPYCGKGKCNLLGCNCDGGCRQGDSTLSCWNIASGCKMTSYYSDVDLLAAIDTDSDGKLSFSEAKTYINENRPTNQDIDEELLKLDTNGDGFLQFNEIDGY